MADARYLRDDFGSLLGHLVEECGEVCAAAGKTMRWGLESVNPELPPEQQETNRAWLLRELDDLTLAVVRLRNHLAPAEHPASGGEE